MTSPIDRIDGIRSILWVWTWLTIFYLVLWFWWALTASTYRYEVAQNTGILTNERWNTDFVLTATLLFHLAVPVSLAYALDSPLRTWRRTMHIILVLLLFVFGIISMSFWAVDYSHANEATANNARNPANDPRWCNLNYAIPGSGCPQTAPTPGLIPSMLTIASPFLWKFWFLVVWLILLILDFAAVMLLLRNAVNAYLDENQEPLVEEKEEEETPKGPPAKKKTTSTVEIFNSNRIQYGYNPLRK